MVVKNDRGNVLILMLLVSSLVLSLGVYITQMVNENEVNVKRFAVDNVAQNIIENVRASVRDMGAWGFTQNNALNTAAFGCLVDNSVSCCIDGSDPCSDPTKWFTAKIAILNAANEFVIGDPANSSLGFNWRSEPCNSFDAAAGNDDCPFQLEVSWLAYCLTTADPRCYQPEVKVQMKLKFSPTNPLRYPINAAKYNTEVVRSSAVSTSNRLRIMTVLENDADTISKTYQFLIQPNVFVITVELWGGGGSGGGAAGNQPGPLEDQTGDPPNSWLLPVADPLNAGKFKSYQIAGTGGGSGAYARVSVPVKAGEIYEIIVGGGGVSVAGSIGASGGATSLRRVAPGLPYPIITAGGGKFGTFCGFAPEVLPKCLAGEKGRFQWNVSAVEEPIWIGRSSTFHGQDGGSYNDVLDYFQQGYLDFNPLAIPYTLSLKYRNWVEEYWGGRGGNAPGGGGLGGRPTHTRSFKVATKKRYAEATYPGAGGNGTVGSIGMRGRGGRAIVWW